MLCEILKKLNITFMMCTFTLSVRMLAGWQAAVVAHKRILYGVDVTPILMGQWIHISPGIVSIIEKISFAYTIITVPFYTLILFALIDAQIKKAPILAGSFFKICITAGINDIVTLLNHYFGAVFPEWGWFTEVYLAMGKPCVYIYLIVAWGSTINQALSLSVLTTNQLSALLFPLQYHKIWHGFRLKLAMFIQMVPGYIFASFILFNDVDLLRTEEGGVMLRMTDQEEHMAHCTSAMIFLLLNSLFLIVAHCYLFYAVRKRNQTRSKAIFVTRTQSTHNTDMCRRREIRLFIMSSIIVVMQLILLLIFSTRVLPWLPSALGFLYIFFNPLSIIYSGISAYLLWICSDALRRYVLALLRIKRSLN